MMSNNVCEIDSKRTNKVPVSSNELHQDKQNELEKIKMNLNSIKNQIRLVKLRQNEANSKLGFSLRGGKEATGFSVGVFVSHVEKGSEADRKGLKIGDQLLQVNGLNVNQATYEEVIGLIKQTPKCHDILLKVNNFGKIPFQEKSGDCIKWLQVMDLIDTSEAVKPVGRILDKITLECLDSANNERGKQTRTNSTNEHEIKSPYSSSNNTKTYICKQATSSLSSDEGIGSCENRRAVSLSSESENESHQAQQNQAAATTNDGYQEDSAVSSTLTLSNDETCSCSSACSISISSVQSTTTTSTTTSGDLENEAIEQQQQYSSLPEDIEIIVQVPGGKQTNESFGCGVVKGPDEWPGIFVQNVKPGSLAQRVGLQPGDQLTRADGQLLVELTFDAAIGLIKQLQQQQDELLLHVKKGAALKHLSENRQRNQANQNQLQTHLSGTETELTSNAVVASKQQQQEPLNITCRKREMPTKATSKTVSDELDETSWSFDVSSSSLSSTTSTNQMQAPSSESTEDRKGFTTSNNEISSTQNQLSGKRWSGAMQQQVAARSQDEGKKFDQSQNRTINSRGGVEEEEEIDLLEEDTKQTTIRIGGNNLSSHTNANQVSRKSKPNVVANSIESRSSNQNLTSSKFLAGEEKPNSVYEMKIKHKRQQQVASLCKSDNYDLNGNHLENNEDKSVKRGYSFEDDSRKVDCHYQIKRNSNNKTRQECEDDRFRGDVNNGNCADGGVDNNDNEYDDNEGKIRIVSQNCKLHHQPFHNNYSKSNLVQEKFPHHPETRQSQKVKSRDILARKIQANEVNSKKRQTVDDMGRQLDIKGNSRGPSMHRYVSFENLNSSRLACSTQKQQQSQQHLPRGSSATRRANADENRYINDDYIIYSRPQVEQQRSLSKHRFYSRSSSVLGQNTFQGTCCTQARPSLVDLASQIGNKAVQCAQKQQQKRQLGISRMVRQHSQCCLQQTTQQQQQQQQHYQHHHYGSSGLHSPFALSRSKARSMDKLNMSINLNYVNIGQPNPYKVSRQALLGKACGAGSMTSGSNGSNNVSKQQRRMLLKNQLAGHSTTLGGIENDSLACCKQSNTSWPFTCQPNSTPVSFYNYSTASRLISTISGAPSADVPVARMRLLQAAACCSSLFPETCNANLCHSSLCSSLIKNQQKVCCSPSLDRPIYSKCNMVNTKLHKQLNNNSSSYSCCSSSALPCCPTNSLQNNDMTTICSFRRDQSLSNIKYAESSKGTTTDSSGYLSSSNERYHAPRLLKMCPALASPPQPPPPPPPPPKQMTSSSKQHYNCPGFNQQQRDTRQRLTTFLSTGCQTPTPQLSSNNNRRPPNSSDVSPICSSSYSSPPTSISSTHSDHSSLSIDHLRSVSPLNNQQQRSNAVNNCNKSGNIKQTGNQKASYKSIPCPPPMPAPDIEFERKLSSILRQQDMLETKNTCGDESGNNNGKNKSSNNNLIGGRNQETNKNRLCFVDELKLIAKRQQQQSISQVSCTSSLSSIPVSLSSGGETSAIGSSSSSSSSSASSSSSDHSAIDSSTLIKIINASKSSSNVNRNKVSYGCQVTSRNRQHLQQKQQQHSEENNNKKYGHKCFASSNEQDNDHQLRYNNIKSSHLRKNENSPNSVVKLDDEHSKRRQHEMLMKEFKSAHSRMFKRRNANLQEESNQQVHSTNSDSNKPLESNKQQLKAPMRTVGATKTTAGLLSQQPVHLAAAN